MSNMYFEDHPTDPDKVILRKPRYEDDDDIQEYKRPWVELTDKEIRALAKRPNDIEIPMTGRMWIFVGELMKKLKEKNNA